MTGSKKTRLDQLLLKILGISFATILALLPIHAFVSTWGGAVIGPLLVWKSWKEILIVLLIPVVVGLCVLRPDIRKAMWGSWLNRAIAGYVILTLIMAVASSAPAEAVIAGLLLNLRFLAMFVLAEIIVVANPPWLEKFKATLAPWIIGVGVILSVFAVLQVTVIPKDFLSNFGYDKDTTIAPYLLVDQDPNALRAFATMRGPNTLAAYLLLPLAVAVVVWWHNRKAWWALGSAGLMAVALALTGSRSGWLGAAAALAALAYVTLPRKKLFTWIKFGTVPLIAVIGIVLWLAVTVPAVRLAIFHSGGNDQTESLTEGSSDKHWQAALVGIQEIVSNPLGQGVGKAGPASFYSTAPSIPEDYYIQIGQEVGVAGLALFVGISIMIAKRLWQKQQMPRALLASFIGVAVINIFLHGWADDPTAMTWWGIAGLFVAGPAAKRVQSK
jgi:hypothetical protein